MEPSYFSLLKTIKSLWTLSKRCCNCPFWGETKTQHNSKFQSWSHCFGVSVTLDLTQHNARCSLRTLFILSYLFRLLYWDASWGNPSNFGGHLCFHASTCLWYLAHFTSHPAVMQACPNTTVVPRHEDRCFLTPQCVQWGGRSQRCILFTYLNTYSRC